MTLEIAAAKNPFPKILNFQEEQFSVLREPLTFIWNILLLPVEPYKQEYIENEKKN